MDIEQWITISFGIFAIILLVNRWYPKNYYLQAFFLLIGNWYYVNMLTVFANENVAFPIFMVILNTLLNIFLLQDSLREIIGNKK